VIATCSDDRTVAMLSNSRKLPVLRRYVGSLAPLLTLDISAHRDKIVAAGFDTLLHLWPTACAEPSTAMAAHSSAVTAVQFTANAECAITGSLDGFCRMFSLRRKAVLRTYFWCAIPITFLLLLPSERAFLAAYSGKEAVVNLVAVDLPGMAEHPYPPNNDSDAGVLGRFVGHRNRNGPMSIQVVGGEVVMPSEDGTVQAWSFETQQRAWKVKVGRRGIVKAAISGDGTLLAAGNVIEGNVTLRGRKAKARK
jgi:WD40 repeat protein